MKRFFSLLSCVLLISMLCCVNVNAEITRSSEYIRSCRGSLESGSSRGKIDLSFTITATKSMTSLGISQVDVYKSDGTFVKTIYGSTSNGLLSNSGQRFTGSYTIALSSGETYYTELTFIAKDSSGSDTNTITTNTATAK